MYAGRGSGLPPISAIFVYLTRKSYFLASCDINSQANTLTFFNRFGDCKKYIKLEQLLCYSPTSFQIYNSHQTQGKQNTIEFSEFCNLVGGSSSDQLQNRTGGDCKYVHHNYIRYFFRIRTVTFRRSAKKASEFYTTTLIFLPNFT